jgi:hypothetical protein
VTANNPAGAILTLYRRLAPPRTVRIAVPPLFCDWVPQKRRRRVSDVAVLVHMDGRTLARCLSRWADAHSTMLTTSASTLMVVTLRIDDTAALHVRKKPSLPPTQCADTANHAIPSPQTAGWPWFTCAPAGRNLQRMKIIHVFGDIKGLRWGHWGPKSRSRRRTLPLLLGETARKASFEGSSGAQRPQRRCISVE